jgi:glucosamine-phosphate N-acetyltransferase
VRVCVQTTLFPHIQTPIYLFDPSLLRELPVQSTQIPSTLKLRPLQLNDYNNGYLQLLAQLTNVGEVSAAQFHSSLLLYFCVTMPVYFPPFTDRFNVMRTHPQAYYVCVLANIDTDKIVACASLVLEWKFIHSAGFRGRIEDVVVDEKMRGLKLGNMFVVFIYLFIVYILLSLCEHVTALGRYLGCYKMSLECKTHLIHFYSKCGFNVDAGNNFLVQRFDHSVSSAELSANGTKAEEMGSMKVEFA